MYTLSKQTQANIASTVGKSFEEICESSSVSDYGAVIGFSRERIVPTVGRGSPYLSRLQFTTLEEADNESMRIIGESHGERQAN